MAHRESTYQPNSGIERWIDERLPLPRMMHDQLAAFPTPRNLNYWWTYGGILTFCLVVQLLTGIVLAMHYQPSAEMAFTSIAHLRRPSRSSSTCSTTRPACTNSSPLRLSVNVATKTLYPT